MKQSVPAEEFFLTATSPGFHSRSSLMCHKWPCETDERQTVTAAVLKGTDFYRLAHLCMSLLSAEAKACL